MNNDKFDIQSLQLHEEIRQLSPDGGQCISCDLINFPDSKVLIEVSDKETGKISRLLCLKGYCPICGKRMKK